MGNAIMIRLSNIDYFFTKLLITDDGGHYTGYKHNITNDKYISLRF